MFEKKLNILLEKLDIIGHQEYQHLNEFAWFFRRANKEIYLVGGCVRDLLLNKKPKDFDFCTSLKPEEVKDLLKSADRYDFIDTGLKHGTITVYDKLAKTGYEITTFRVDGKYEDGWLMKQDNSVILKILGYRGNNNV